MESHLWHFNDQRSSNIIDLLEFELLSNNINGGGAAMQAVEDRKRWTRSVPKLTNMYFSVYCSMIFLLCSHLGALFYNINFDQKKDETYNN